MLTAERRRTVLAECLEAGAVGWIGVTTPLDEVDSTLGRVLSGESIIGRTDRAELLDHLRLERARSLRAQATFEQLTHREALVLAALTDGLSAEEIARDHFVALTTVRSQIRAVLQKLGVRSQLAAVRWPTRTANSCRTHRAPHGTGDVPPPRSIGSAARPTPFAPPEVPFAAAYDRHPRPAVLQPSDAGRIRPPDHAWNSTTARVPAISGRPNG